MTSKRLDIFEVRTEDGGVGLRFGDGPVFMGYDEGDLLRLLGAIFVDHGNAGGAEYDDEPVDGDLQELAEQYLDAQRAEARRRELREW